MPYTPIQKDNMVAWLAARSDPEGYGSLFAFKYPKDKLIFGPMQIEARADQDTTISQQFTLWGQGGVASDSRQSSCRAYRPIKLVR